MSRFQFEVLMNNAVMNICGQVLLFPSGIQLHIEQPHSVATLCVALGRRAHTVSLHHCPFPPAVYEGPGFYFFWAAQDIFIPILF